MYQIAEERYLHHKNSIWELKKQNAHIKSKRLKEYNDRLGKGEIEP
jgi:hypothetical protein